MATFVDKTSKIIEYFQRVDTIEYDLCEQFDNNESLVPTMVAGSSTIRRQNFYRPRNVDDS